jgi:SET domain-containing protein
MRTRRPEVHNSDAKESAHTRMGLMIRSSAIHAAGCYTTSPIRKGARVAEYTGHKLTKRQADRRYEESPITYLFGLGDGSIVIDGHSAAMFINHSCEGNCETTQDDGRVWVIAVRNIAAGEEITYDYCLYDGDETEEALCNCGTRKCRGTMYSAEEVKLRKKKARKAALRLKKKLAGRAAKKRNQAQRG